MSENPRAHYPSSDDVRSNLEVCAADFLAQTLLHLAAPSVVSLCMASWKADTRQGQWEQGWLEMHSVTRMP